ncbi:MAG: GNAT family N-acetyltransferase [Armatimonadetes bacterium]|nr:GNAT family N-acetyltransferase [Armatimonadota bacterium]
MREIRTIDRGEAKTFLRLLCDVFDLDFRRARDIFFKEPFFELKRKWALYEDGRMVGCLTTVPLEFGDGQAAGIAGVAIHSGLRGRGLGGELLKEVLKEAAAAGEPRALLFAHETRLYEKQGFRQLDRVVSQPLPGGEGSVRREVLSEAEVRTTYDAWAAEDAGRLRRDERRWGFWSWNMKSPYRLPGGYVCAELGRVRELLPAYQSLPFTDPVEWYGLETMGRSLGVPLGNPRSEMLLMGIGFDRAPQMFLSDQF